VQIKPQSKKNAKTEYKFRHKYGPNLELYPLAFNRLNFYKNLNKNLEKVELIVKFFALTTDLPQNSCGLGWTY
jgi:hypothetical protein